MQTYVITLAADYDCSSIVIIHKNRGPAAVKDKINFPGGKIEPGESSLTAARRELDEETGLCIPEDNFELLTIVGDGVEYQLDIYVVLTTLDTLCTAVTKTDELIEVVKIEDILSDIGISDKYAPGVDQLLDLMLQKFKPGATLTP